VNIVANGPIIRREWAMSNANTFSIKPVAKLIEQYAKNSCASIDPFANTNKIALITNDLDQSCGCDYSMDAIEFLRSRPDSSADLVLFDPPYSSRQVAEHYKRLGKTVNMETTQSSFWGRLRDEIARVTMENGIVISFGWNSVGVGKTRGFEQIELLIVCHGSAKNDTICTVERKRGGYENTIFG
jgi:hypothetical protein